MGELAPDEEDTMDTSGLLLGSALSCTTSGIFDDAVDLPGCCNLAEMALAIRVGEGGSGSFRFLLTPTGDGVSRSMP